MSTFNLRPISDMGGQQILGMSGSLNGYIRTGNPFDKRFCHPDSVEILQKAKTKRKTKDALALLGIAGGIAGLMVLAKKGKLKPVTSKISSLFNGIKTRTKKVDKGKISDVIKKPFSAVKNFFGKFSKSTAKS